MSIQLLGYKLKKINEVLNERKLKALEVEFAEIARQLPIAMYSSEASRGYIFSETIFPLVILPEWHDTPVFQALLVEFLQLDHSIPRNISTLLVSRFIQKYAELQPARKRSICMDDKEFLTFAYVLAATAHSNFELEKSLGLGSAIVRKLKDGIKVIENSRTDVFVPEYDAMLGAITIEILHESRRCEWALDLQRLKYELLKELQDEALPWILEETLPRVLDTLYQIGCGNQLSSSLHDELLMLEKAHVIDSVANGRGRHLKWTLSSFGADVSAKMYTSIVSKAPSFLEYDVSQFMSIPYQWQSQVLMQTKVLSTEFVEELVLEKLEQLSPQILELCIKRVISCKETDVTTAFLKEMLDKARLPWHKASILRSLADIAPSQNIANVVAKSLSGEQSDSIIEAANVVLAKWDLASQEQFYG